MSFLAPIFSPISSLFSGGDQSAPTIAPSSAPKIIATPAVRAQNTSISSAFSSDLQQRRGRSAGGGEAGLALDPLGYRGGGGAVRSTLLGK